MLYIWSSAKDVLISKCITSVLKRVKTPFRILPVSPNIPKLKKDDVLMVCGGKAIEILSKAGVVPKNRTVGTLRGKVLPLHQGNVLCTYDPTILNIDPDKAGDIVWDTRLASRLATTQSIVPKTGTYKWVKNYSQLVKELKQRYKDTGKPTPISIDLETVGLTPHARGVWIVSISVTIDVGMADMVYFETKDSHKSITGIISQINWLNNAKEVRVRGANYKFDMLWQSVKWGINSYDSFTFDTNLIGSLLNENRSNSLNTHAKLYTSIGGYDDPFNAKHDKSRMDLVPKDDLLEYGGGDTDACLRVSKVMLKELNKDKRLKTFYSKLLLPCVQGCRVMEQRGVLVDKERYADLRNEVVTELASLQKQAFSKMSRRLRSKYSDNLSLTRDVILREHLFTKSGLNLKPQILTAKKKEPSTTLEHLELLAEKNKEVVEFVEIMRDFNSAKKTLSTYIDGFMKHLRSDGRFHSTYMLYRGAYGNKNDDSGTVTGRTSAKDPAYQTIPKHTKWAKPLRSVYVAPPGFVHMNVDYSQGELRIAACIANELSMIKAYKQGIDMHLITGAEVFGLTLKEALMLKKKGDPQIKAIRQGGKAGNFGLIYGMQAKGFVNYAKTSYGVDLTLGEAESFRDRFFESKPRLLPWHEEAKETARQYGSIRTPLGRVRHLPLINSNDNELRAKQERQSLNSPVQATLSDLGLLAMGELYKKYPTLWCYGFTHDALTFYIPENEVQVWAQRIKHVMENLPIGQFGWKPQLQFTVDVEVSTESLADLEEYDMAA